MIDRARARCVRIGGPGMLKVSTTLSFEVMNASQRIGLLDLPYDILWKILSTLTMQDLTALRQVHNKIVTGVVSAS